MLPDRSKRYAVTDGEPPRLRLVRTWQLALTALLAVGLLRAIFPQQKLVQRLYDQERLDDLSLSYVQNLYRTEPQNLDLKILLARTRPDVRTEDLEIALTAVLRDGDLRQRSEARLLLLKSYEAASRHSSPQASTYERKLRDLVASVANDRVPPHLAGAFAATAFRLGMSQQGLRLLEQISQQEPVTALRTYAEAALAQGRHELAAEYYLLARSQTTERDLARHYFQRGIASLMAASLFPQAMAAAERSLGDLQDDPETLRFLMRMALAAGEPHRAAGYAERLVFPEPSAAAGRAP